MPKENRFKFNLGDRVSLTESREAGNVTGRAEFDHSQNTYLVRYRAGDGRQVEAWWGESAVKASAE